MTDATAVFDTVILGAGIAGASLARQLAGRQRVALVEREDLRGLSVWFRGGAACSPLLHRTERTCVPGRGQGASTGRGI